MESETGKAHLRDLFEVESTELNNWLVVGGDREKEKELDEHFLKIPIS